MRKAVFLDRDGTIIDNQGDLGDPDDVTIIEGATEAIKSLESEGWLIVVVTNQAGVARGVFTENDIHQVHKRIDSFIPSIDRYYYCCYHPKGKLKEWREDHPCRKPSPGMLLQAANDLDIDLKRSWLVGDSDRDIQAGQTAGTRTIWLTEPDRVTDVVTPTLFAPTLKEAALFILAESRVD